MADYAMGNNLRVQSLGHPSGWKRDTQGPTTFQAAVTRQFDELQELLIRKHLNYGPKNILSSPGSPLLGLRVRIWDKLARINHMLDYNVEDQVGESLLETFGDMANYAIIARLVIRDEFGLPMEHA